MGPKYKRDRVNHCMWCGKPTVMEAMLLPETPILEFMEDKINGHGRQDIWGEDGDWSMKDLDSDFEAELLVYDELLNTVSDKIVCIGCLKVDDDLWNKYYGIDEDDNPDDDDEILFDLDLD